MRKRQYKLNQEGYLLKKIYAALSLITLLLFITPATSSAMRIGETNPLADITVQDSRLAWTLSNEYQLAVSSEQIGFLRNQDFSYAEIVALYGLADASNKPFSKILEMRQGDNLKWSEILARLNLKPSDIFEKGTKILNNNQLDEDGKLFSALFVNNQNNPIAEETVAKSKKSTSPSANSNSGYNSSGKSRF